MKSEINPLRYVPSFCNGHIDLIDRLKVEIFYTIGELEKGYYAIAYSGKRKKDDFFYRFSTKEKMEKYIEDYIKGIENTLKAKQERKVAQKEMAKNVVVKVGDLFCNSWGWEQTNVDFYQVIKVTNKTAVLAPISGKSVEGSAGYMSCQLVAVKDSFTGGENLTKRIQSYDGKPYFSMEFGSMSPTTETQKHYCSWYA